MIKKLMSDGWFLALIALLLSGCGGGGIGDEEGHGFELINDSDVALADGIWVGTSTSDATGVISDLTGIVYDGEIRFMFSDEIDVGSIQVNGSNFTASVSAYSQVSGYLGAATIEGMYESGDWMSGTYRNSAGGTGTLALNYSNLTDRGASLATAQGIWSFTDVFGTDTITIQNDGSFLGSDTSGCVYSGDVAAPDSTKNLYTMSMEITSCGIYDGPYTGLAVIADHFSGGTNNSFWFSVNSTDYVIVRAFQRQ